MNAIDKYLQLGVRLCAIYLALVAVLPVAIVLASVLQELVTEGSSFAVNDSWLLVFLGISMLSVFVVITSIGLWRFWNLGRSLAILLSLAHLIVALTVFSGKEQLNGIEWTLKIAVGLIGIIGLFYLNHPRVKNLFSKGDGTDTRQTC